MNRPGRARASRARATVSAGFFWSVNALCTTTVSAFARTVRSPRSIRSAARAPPPPADAAAALPGPPYPEGAPCVVNAEVAHVHPLEPRRERGVDDDALPRQVGLEPEDRAQAEEHHAGRPSLRDARHQVV